MTWLTILRLVLSVAARLTEIVRDKGLMEAGAAKSVLKSLRFQEDQVRTAQEVRRKTKAILDANPELIREEDENLRDD